MLTICMIAPSASAFESQAFDQLNQAAAVGANPGRVGSAFDGSAARNDTDASVAVEAKAWQPALTGPAPLPAARPIHRESSPMRMAADEPSQPGAGGEGFFDYFGAAIVAPFAGAVRGAIAGAKGGAEAGQKIGGMPLAVGMGIVVGALGLVVGAVVGVAKCAVGLFNAFRQLFKGNP